MRRTLIAAALTTAALTSAALLGPGAAMAATPPPEDIIKAWDKNGDGGVDKAEWIAAGRPEKHFVRVDTDKDGKVSAEELKTAMASRGRRAKSDNATSPPKADKPNL